jgi:flagellar motor switch protein FliG
MDPRLGFNSEEEMIDQIERDLWWEVLFKASDALKNSDNEVLAALYQDTINDAAMILSEIDGVEPAEILSLLDKPTIH